MDLGPEVPEPLDQPVNLSQTVSPSAAVCRSVDRFCSRCQTRSDPDRALISLAFLDVVGDGGRHQPGTVAVVSAALLVLLLSCQEPKTLIPVEGSWIWDSCLASGPTPVVRLVQDHRPFEEPTRQSCGCHTAAADFWTTKITNTPPQHTYTHTYTELDHSINSNQTDESCHVGQGLALCVPAMTAPLDLRPALISPAPCLLLSLDVTVTNANMPGC